MTIDTRPIGLFDSGLGGLTVLRSLAERFPHESFVYLGDVARLPYGNKSPETVRLYGEQCLQFLTSQNVKALIIACNTASTVFLGEENYCGRPLFNVIEPGSTAALVETRNHRIGVIGTSTTIQLKAYSRTIQGLRPNTYVEEVACPLFVPLAEEGLGADEVTHLMAQRYLSPLKRSHIDTLILGCTHYPLLKNDIAAVMGPAVKLVESGMVLGELLEKKLLSTQGKAGQAQPGPIQIYTTDVTSHFSLLAQKIMSPLVIGELNRVVL